MQAANLTELVAHIQGMTVVAVALLIGLGALGTAIGLERGRISINISKLKT